VPTFSRLLVTVVVASIALSACRKPPSPEQTAAAGTAGQAPAASSSAQPQPQPPAPPKPMPAQLPEVLARVNGQPVTRTEFDRLLKNMELGGGPIPAERRDEVLRGALDQLVTYTVMTQEAKARKVVVSDAEVDGRVKQMQSQFPSDAEFKKALAARDMTVDQLRADARMDMMIGKMLDAEVSGAPAATDAEAREFYDKNPDKFKQGETARASHILIRVDPQADEAAKTQARQKIDGILKRVRAGEDFAALAREHSNDGSAAQGGDLGVFQRGQMVPAFDQAVFALEPGQVSDVVTTQFGHHIIKLAEKRGASTVPYEQVSPRIVEYLSGQKKQQRADTFIEETKKKARIEVLV
jgi:peptidyl-prolyl cis-trans isomerase C